MALPILLVSFSGAFVFFRRYFNTINDDDVSSISPKSQSITPETTSSPENILRGGTSMTSKTNQLLPFYIHSTALTFLLLFSAHTQIALRVCVTDPVIWWSLTGLAFKWEKTESKAEIQMQGQVISKEQNMERVTHLKHGKDDRFVDKTGRKGMTMFGKIWIWWCVIFGSISIVLWSGHYPPA